MACRRDVVVFPPEVVEVGQSVAGPVRGMYVLNEGNMGSNKASLDYYDFHLATYTRNIYGFTNPHVVKDLGDVGNDLQIYGDRLYAVINCSNKIEVMHADNAVRIGQIDIPNCRYLCFDGGYGYATSYAGPVQVGTEHAQIGYVAKFDTATLQVVATCNVGFQPDQMAIVGNRMYVANSGGYLMPNYEHELSVIDLPSFTEVARIPVAINLHQVLADRYGGLWITSRGDYISTPASLYYLGAREEYVSDTLAIAASALCMRGDSLYCLSSAYNPETYDMEIQSIIIDVRTHEVLTRNFISDGTLATLRTPYGLAVHPLSGDIYLTDAGNYVTPGYLHCYSPSGVRRWSVRCGDIPAHFAFLFRP